MIIDIDLSKTDKQPNIANKDLAPLANLVFSSSILRDTMLNFNQLCDPCDKSKSIQTILQKNMTMTFNKLEEVYIHLWDLHYLPSFFGKIYSAILYCKFI